MSDTETRDVASEFAAMMAGAASAEGADAPRARRADATDEAPYGYHSDGRPRRSNGGRPRRSKSIEELRESANATGDAGADDSSSQSAPADRPPDDRKRAKGHLRSVQKDEKPLPPFREGQIARGINRLYRKAGKIIRVMDPEIGVAIIDATRKEDDDDITVGEAWEELARTNPRIRRFLLNIIAGGAWGQLFMAHAPILLAVIMKDSIRKHIPFMGVIESLAEPDEDTPAGEGGLPGGMTSDDVAQAAAMAREQMAKMGVPISDDMARMAEGMFRQQQAQPAGTPAGFTRQQPRNTTRAERRSG